MPGRMRYELVKVAGIIDFRQIVVEQVPGAVTKDLFELILKYLPISVRFLDGIGNKPADGNRLFDPFLRWLDLADVKLHDLAHHASDMAAGQAIVAYKSDAVRSEATATNGHQLFPGLGRHPGINAMGH